MIKTTRSGPAGFLIILSSAERYDIIFSICPADTTTTEHAHTHTLRSKTIKSLEEVQSNRHLLATSSTHELAILVTASKARMERQRRLGRAFHSLSCIFLIPHRTVVRTDEKKVGVSASRR